MPNLLSFKDPEIKSTALSDYSGNECVLTGFGIYKWTNLITGRILVGQTGSTQGFKLRLKNYLCHLRKGTYGSHYFQNSWNKHGEQAFEFSIIENHQDDSKLTEREQFWVNFYRGLPGGIYNLIGPVDAPRRGAKNTPEHCAKISAASKGKSRGKGKKKGPRSLESRLKQSNSIKGKKRFPMSEEAKAKSSATQKGRAFTKEHKDNLSAALKKSEKFKEAQRKNADNSRGKPKETLRVPVNRVDLNTGEIKEYVGVQATAMDGFNPSHVSAVCLGKRPTHLKFGWEHSGLGANQ